MNALRQFKLAVIFLTRIPVKVAGEVSSQDINQASGYFAWVGVLLGVLLALIYSVLSYFLPEGIAVLLTLGGGLLITGAFHEDGFADVWDGFGGGWSVADKLTIMKDSRLGTYGAAALVILLLTKYQALLVLSERTIYVCSALILAHGLSRVMATSLIGKLGYVQADTRSKVKPVAQSLAYESKQLLYVCGFALLIVSWLAGLFTLWQSIALLGVLWLCRAICIYWFKRQLGGYTGDCLGATQQLGEVAVYLFCLGVWL
ncbi:adenosylcobinamide-GDP ribazoletransferase [Pseudoalteromonas sp. OOF1S-7]|uniref:adenosylcobinamide-GDP ribazoletransferase n=1 Tax=Pseudoalteromonas sp. OOF1S-7 TaxID=2917757 RepID=UPI001EF419D9|nr:adenosylcobinamide-GDP ribazoletransferase [Pseudoalteromonas sp. OOF1S-7]MCG7535322.1 adenosylcobinamide-GDP ribazoletransferase [Pseudoalteromonas sp. OOF1S-7]